MSNGSTGWNRSKQGTESGVRSAKKAPSAMKGIVAGLVTVCALGGLCLWLFSGGDDAPAQGTRHKAQGTIKAVKPAPAPKAEVVPQKPEPKKPMTVKERIKAAQEKAAIAREEYESGKKERKVDVDLRKFQKRRFEFDSEEQIAMLLETKPGDFILGDYVCGDRFVIDFNNSLAKPIVVKADDDEATQQLKADVSAAKAELKAAMDRGEDITKIMKETYLDLQRLGQYKDSIEQELASLRRDDTVSADDYEDFVTAANKLLEEKGCKPIRHPKFLMRQIRERKAASNAGK